MTALLESPVGVLDATRLEERQPDVPLTCTDRGSTNHPREECGKPAHWEGMCMGCGRIFRRCPEHYADEVVYAEADGCPFECFKCGTWFYLDQFFRLR